MRLTRPAHVFDNFVGVGGLLVVLHAKLSTSYEATGRQLLGQNSPDEGEALDKMLTAARKRALPDSAKRRFSVFFDGSDGH